MKKITILLLILATHAGLLHSGGATQQKKPCGNAAIYL